MKLENQTRTLFSNCQKKSECIWNNFFSSSQRRSKNGSYLSRLQIRGGIVTYYESRSSQTSRIHDEKNKLSRFHAGFFRFSRITNDIVFTISRTLFFNFTIFTNKKMAFTTSRIPLGGPLHESSFFSTIRAVGCFSLSRKYIYCSNFH